MVTYEHQNSVLDSSLESMKVQFSVGDVFMVFEYAEYDLAGLINSNQVVCTMHFSFYHQKQY